MSPMPNPFLAPLRDLGERALAANRQLGDWQIAQAKLAEKQATTFLELSRAGLDASIAASNAMGKTLLDAFVPAPSETKASS